MALTRAKKTQKVEVLAKELATSTSAIVGTFAKLTVSQDFELRQKVRDAGGRYRVLKNKLAARASHGTGIEAALQGLKGVSSVAYTSGDPVALAKALSAWVKDNAEFTFKLGIVDGKLITVEEVQSLATMPGKEEIFAKLLFLINAPATRLATVLNATGKNVAVVLDQAVQQEKFAAAPETNAASTPVAEGASTPEPTAAPEASVAEEAPEEAVVSEVPPRAGEVAAPSAGEVEIARPVEAAPSVEQVQAEVGAEGPEEVAARSAAPVSETGTPLTGEASDEVRAEEAAAAAEEVEAHGETVTVEDAIAPGSATMPEGEGAQGGQKAGS